ncbi:hypothetical protein DSOUD_2130 [Desulfuromonas soudanensis]|uniref:Uncharacterized protein n=1 Tax=Desulfuromonas soudanensis TaxID=1603606 RepID=A0A0M4D749_9BACT|nr:hypothetical protein [Desulfuromonas soudanensis]ALC16897.1 hypothetical protein DSOUD_2130 [Desulfuromonas soudanensis]
MRLGNEKDKKFADGDEAEIRDRNCAKKDSAWQSVISRVKKTNLYQIFIVRAMKRRFTKLMYAITIYLLMIGHITFVDLLTPPQRLDQLETTEGLLQDLNKSGRRSYHRMVVRKENGNQYIFKANLDSVEWNKINDLKGEFIKVYYDYDIHPLLYREKIVKAVSHNNNFLRKYDYFERSVEVYNFDKIIFGSCSGVVFIFIFYIYWTNRKEN